MIVRVIRHRTRIGVYDEHGVLVCYLPSTHHVVVRMQGAVDARFEAQWEGNMLEIGERK